MPIFKLRKGVIRKVNLIISKGVIRKVNSIISSFLWAGTQQDRKFHLANLEILDFPIKQGGWGLKFQTTPCQMEFAIWLCSSPEEAKNDELNLPNDSFGEFEDAHPVRRHCESRFRVPTHTLQIPV